MSIETPNQIHFSYKVYYPDFTAVKTIELNKTEPNRILSAYCLKSNQHIDKGSATDDYENIYIVDDIDKEHLSQCFANYDLVKNAYFKT